MKLRLLLPILLVSTAAIAQETAPCACQSSAALQAKVATPFEKKSEAKDAFFAAATQLISSGATPAISLDDAPNYLHSWGFTCGKGAAKIYYGVSLITNNPSEKQPIWSVAIVGKNAADYEAALAKHCMAALPAFAAEVPEETTYRTQDKAISRLGDAAGELAITGAYMNPSFSAIAHPSSFPVTVTFQCADANSPHYTLILRETADKQYALSLKLDDAQ